MADFVVRNVDERIEWIDIQWSYNIDIRDNGSVEFERITIPCCGHGIGGMFRHITGEHVNGDTCLESCDSD
jgi:hypothetical protein